MLCMANLIHSLQTSQDFLRRDSLSCGRGGAIPFALNRLNREEPTDRIARLVPQANDSDCLSNDLFAGMRFLRLRPLSMDTRHEEQEDKSSRNCWTERCDTREQAPLHLGFPAECGKTRQP